MGTSREAIDAGTLDCLLSPRGEATLAHLSTLDLDERHTLPLLTELRRDFDAREAGALLTLARLRLRAAAKFPSADRLFFTREALEQATAHDVAVHRARRVDRLAPPGPVLDLGCGIGGDLLALARYRRVIAFERDPLRLRLARANVDAMGLSERVTLCGGDWTQAKEAGTLPEAAAAFADPGRRSGGRRVFDPEAMEPPLSALLRLREHIPALGVKTRPGIDDADLPRDAAVEFISHERVCKEALLWFGPLREGKEPTGTRWASVHDGNAWHTLHNYGGVVPVGALEAGQWLHEPDPAVIRAGAFVPLCRRLNAHLFDPHIAYLVSERAPDVHNPFVQSFRLWEILPLRLKRINARLRALNVGSVEIKKRGAPIEPESLRARLTLVDSGGHSDTREAVLFLTRRGDERLALLGERVTRWGD